MILHISQIKLYLFRFHFSDDFGVQKTHFYMPSVALGKVVQGTLSRPWGKKILNSFGKNRHYLHILLRGVLVNCNFFINDFPQIF